MLALTIGFATLAALVMHVRHIGEICLPAYYVGVCVTLAFSIPIVIWTMRAGRSRQRLWRALGSTTVAGVLVSEAITVTIISQLSGERELYLGRLGVAIRNAEWILLAVPLGAVPALAACVALLAAARMVETRYAAPTGDVVSRIAVPILSLAGLVAAAEALFLDPLESVVAFYGAWAGLVGLGVIGQEDLTRLKWLGRIFSGTDPHHVLEACAGDQENVQRYVDLAYAGSLVRGRACGSSYRTPARGEAFALVGFTEQETARPIRRRIALGALSACGIVGLVAIAWIIQTSEVSPR